jgi:hypothetical protein
MTKEQQNKVIIARWFKEFWGNPWNPAIIDEFGAPDILVQHPMHGRRKGAGDSEENDDGIP